MVGIDLKDICVDDEAQSMHGLFAMGYRIVHDVVTSWKGWKKIWHHTFCNDDFRMAADSCAAKSAFKATQKERVRITSSATTKSKIVRTPANGLRYLQFVKVPQGAAGRGSPGKSGWQGKRSETEVQREHLVDRADMYKERCQGAQQATDEVSAPKQEFILPVGEQRRLLHEVRYERLSLVFHAPGEDR